MGVCGVREAPRPACSCLQPNARGTGAASQTREADMKVHSRFRPGILVVLASLLATGAMPLVARAQPGPQGPQAPAPAEQPQAPAAPTGQPQKQQVPPPP